MPNTKNESWKDKIPQHFRKGIISHSAQAEYFTKISPQQVADDIQGYTLLIEPKMI